MRDLIIAFSSFFIVFSSFTVTAGLINGTSSNFFDSCYIIDSSANSDFCSTSSTSIRADQITGELGLFHEGNIYGGVSHIYMEETLRPVLADGVTEGTITIHMQTFGSADYDPISGYMNAWHSLSLTPFWGATRRTSVRDIFRWGNGGALDPIFIDGDTLTVEYTVYASVLDSYDLTLKLYADLYCDAVGDAVCNLSNTSHLNITTSEGLSWAASNSQFLSDPTFGKQEDPDPVAVPVPSSILLFTIALLMLFRKNILTFGNIIFDTGFKVNRTMC